MVDNAVELLDIPVAGGIVSVGEKNTVSFESGENIVLLFGFIWGQPGTWFAHPNIASRMARVLEFKHYWPDGHKTWTAHAGIEIGFVVPKAACKLVKKCKYSYPEIVVNGETITLNTSGGTSGNGWNDWVGRTAGTLVNITLKKVRAVAAVAVRPSGKAAVGRDKASASRYWLELAAEKVVKLPPGSKVVAADNVVAGGEKIAGRIYTVESRSTNGQRMMVKDDEGRRYGFSRQRINWTKTAEVNRINVKYPDEFVYPCAAPTVEKALDAAEKAEKTVEGGVA